jgi:GNAT superfamily N-acetyltransferase
VAEVNQEAVGFVAATLYRDTSLGEIYIIAVDPKVQGQGIGTQLTEVATQWFQQSGMRVAKSGMRVAMIETGGDRGHAPARRVYDNAGNAALRAVRFFKAR